MMLSKNARKALALFAALGLLGGSMVACGPKRQVRNNKISVQDNRAQTPAKPEGGNKAEVATTEPTNAAEVSTGSGTDAIQVQLETEIDGTSSPVQVTKSLDSAGTQMTIESHIAFVETGGFDSDLIAVGKTLRLDWAMKCLTAAEMNGRIVVSSAAKCPVFAIIVEMTDLDAGVAVDQKVALYQRDDAGSVTALGEHMAGTIDSLGFFDNSFYDDNNSFGRLIEQAIVHFVNSSN